MQKVNSSTIDEVGYDLGMLVIKFKNGGKYAFNDVPDKTYKEFLASPSKGKYFAVNIRNKFVTMKMPAAITKADIEKMEDEK